MVFFRLRVGRRFRDVCDNFDLDSQVKFLIDLEDLHRFDPSKYLLLWFLGYLFVGFFFLEGYFFVSLVVFFGLFLHVFYVFYVYLGLLVLFKRRWFINGRK